MQLSEVILGDRLLNIDTGAFGNCVSLSMVSIPASVLAIGDRAFAGCTRLSAVKFQGPGRFIFRFGSFVFDQAAEITTVLFQSDRLYLGTDEIPPVPFLISSTSPYGFVRFQWRFLRQFLRKFCEVCVRRCSGCRPRQRPDVSDVSRRALGVGARDARARGARCCRGVYWV